MTEVTLKFPYLDKPNKNGVVLSGNAIGRLEQLINYSSGKIKATLYPSKGELDYALSSTVRYATVDPVFEVGEISGFDPTAGKVYVNVYDDRNVDSVKSGLVLPRMIGKKVKEGSVVKMEITNLISLDILQYPTTIGNISQ